ncbi:MAG: CAAX prenyl protease-related protein, partial [Kiritimatiellaeota bacterium]|nr:CAAX prenyl protease-related protein [Kiritimatiellota bacterium]
GMMTGDMQAAPKDSPKAKENTIASRRHWVPFAVWIGWFFGVQLLNLAVDPSNDEKALNVLTYAQSYAIMTALGAVAIVMCRPWRYYGALCRKNILPAILLGAAVFALWVGFETAWFKGHFPALAELYERWCVLPFGELRPEAIVDEEGRAFLPYAHETCGWLLTAVRFVGSAVVIAVIEEFFWRGWLYRYAQHLDFLDIDSGVLRWPFYLGVAAVFGAEHKEVVAGVVTGLAWGYFMIRTRDIWALAISHVTANALIGVYVLATGDYRFW